ncbi:unnamed protein product [Amoebophrya sp. A25]|nr:unnamed protein product [Amoebophrya sp. A25]|eukprot:GSA25T00009801001.1
MSSPSEMDEVYGDVVNMGPATGAASPDFLRGLAEAFFCLSEDTGFLTYVRGADASTEPRSRDGKSMEKNPTFAARTQKVCDTLLRMVTIRRVDGVIKWLSLVRGLKEENVAKCTRKDHESNTKRVVDDILAPRCTRTTHDDDGDTHINSKSRETMDIMLMNDDQSMVDQLVDSCETVSLALKAMINLTQQNVIADSLIASTVGHWTGGCGALTALALIRIQQLEDVSSFLSSSENIAGGEKSEDVNEKFTSLLALLRENISLSLMALGNLSGPVCQRFRRRHIDNDCKCDTYYRAFIDVIAPALLSAMSRPGILAATGAVTSSKGSSTSKSSDNHNVEQIKEDWSSLLLEDSLMPEDERVADSQSLLLERDFAIPGTTVFQRISEMGGTKDILSIFTMGQAQGEQSALRSFTQQLRTHPARRETILSVFGAVAKRAGAREVDAEDLAVAYSACDEKSTEVNPQSAAATADAQKLWKALSESRVLPLLSRFLCSAEEVTEFTSTSTVSSITPNSSASEEALLDDDLRERIVELFYLFVKTTGGRAVLQEEHSMMPMLRCLAMKEDVAEVRGKVRLVVSCMESALAAAGTGEDVGSPACDNRAASARTGGISERKQRDDAPLVVTYDREGNIQSINAPKVGGA